MLGIFRVPPKGCRTADLTQILPRLPTLPCLAASHSSSCAWDSQLHPEQAFHEESAARSVTPLGRAHGDELQLQHEAQLHRGWGTKTGVCPNLRLHKSFWAVGHGFFCCVCVQQGGQRGRAVKAPPALSHHCLHNPALGITHLLSMCCFRAATKPACDHQVQRFPCKFLLLID